MSAVIPESWQSLPWLSEVYSEGGRAFAVGGAVRDWLRGEAPHDLDVVVAGLDRERLRGLLRRSGRVDEVGAAFAVLKWRPAAGGESVDVALPRVERSTGPGHRDFALVADAGISIEADLARRDFTLNAIAVELSSGAVLDPFAGRADLARRMLRAVGDPRRRFEEDPLRILRGVGFAARFELELESATRQAMSSERSRLAQLSPERVAAELVKLLMCAARPSVGLRLLESTGALAEVLPELLPSVGFPQNSPHHHLDVWEHVLLAVDQAALRGSGIAVRLAALLHDVDKPATYSEELRADGSVLGHFYGHAAGSAETAARVLARLRIASAPGVARDVPVRVCRMIRHHLVEIDATSSARAVRRFIQRVGGRDAALELLELWAADRAAHAGGLDADAYAQLVDRVLAEGEVPVSTHRLALDGRAIARRFELSGPAIGRLKQQLLDAVVAGEVSNEEGPLLALAQRLLGPRA